MVTTLHAALLSGPLPHDLRSALFADKDLRAALLQGPISFQLATALLDESFPADFRANMRTELMNSPTFRKLPWADRVAIESRSQPDGSSAVSPTAPESSRSNSIASPTDSFNRPVYKMKRNRRSSRRQLTIFAHE